MNPVMNAGRSEFFWASGVIGQILESAPKTIDAADTETLFEAGQRIVRGSAEMQAVHSRLLESTAAEVAGFHLIRGSGLAEASLGQSFTTPLGQRLMDLMRGVRDDADTAIKYIDAHPVDLPPRAPVSI